ncbi:MAG: RDD family protein [Gammaproteobacteria bacterium]|nr:RDD family protein [Gammaproteobacteria bacterium]
MVENPYASSVTPLKQEAPLPPEIVLASRVKRLIARIVDSFVEGIFFWLCVLLFPVIRDAQNRVIENSLSDVENMEFDFWTDLVLPTFTAESVAFWLIGIGITFICQAYLLARYGQTIGKRMLKIRIVKHDSYRTPTLTRSFGIRECGIYLLYWIPFLPVIEVLWIFGEQRRCLHDLWSGTIVIDDLN